MRHLLILVLFLVSSPAAACGPDSDCILGDRTYRIAMPGGTPEGAILYLHGYRGSAAGAMRNNSMRALARELGIALVAGKSYANDWRIPGVPRNRDTDGLLEYTYFEALATALRDRHGIPSDRVLVTGFSAGGMMVWSLACNRGHLFRAYAPISGTFWAPVPESCPSDPVDLMHIHGTSDPVVPLTGRKIANTKQGEVPKALALFTRLGGFQTPVTVPAGELDCTRRSNAQGRILEFCTHPGGHSFRTDYIRRAWEELMPR